MSGIDARELADAFVTAWDPRGDGIASEHAVESMRIALSRVTGEES